MATRSPSFLTPAVVLATLIVLITTALGQTSTVREPKQRIRTVTIPISIFTKKELREGQTEEIVEVNELLVNEDKEPQQILSIRSVTNSPISIALVIQDDLTGNINLQLRSISDFIRTLPAGSRVLVGYLRGGTLQVRQKFTEDLDKAARSIRIVSGSGASGGNGPYPGLIETVKRFEGLPGGRRAVILISDGIDVSQGLSPFAASQSPELDRAIARTQRNSIAVYSIYSPSAFTENAASTIGLSGQNALQRLSDETGGRAYSQGLLSPISFDPFFKDLNMALNRQFALTYLSTHMKKGFYSVEVKSTNPEVKIDHPKGYYYR